MAIFVFQILAYMGLEQSVDALQVATRDGEVQRSVALVVLCICIHPTGEKQLDHADVTLDGSKRDE